MVNLSLSFADKIKILLNGSFTAYLVLSIIFQVMFFVFVNTVDHELSQADLLFWYALHQL